MRVVIADDEVLLREGLDRLLTEAGFEVVGKAATPSELHRRIELTRPDVAIVDIKMPPTHRRRSRRRPRDPRLPLESRYAMRLLEQHPGGVGYLLKERVSDIAVLADALRRIHEGECVLDPTIVARLLKRPRPGGPFSELTERERQVLALMAEGRSNQGICDRLFLSHKTVEAHVKHIFAKLGLEESPDDHRRVLAVIAYLRSSTG
jgi:DNA-binding NarL/FixJ family response regulator